MLLNFIFMYNRFFKTGAYTFKESIVHKDKIQEHLAQ